LYETITGVPGVSDPEGSIVTEDIAKADTAGTNNNKIAARMITSLHLHHQPHSNNGSMPSSNILDFFSFDLIHLLLFL